MMKPTKKMQRVLERMAKIERMERGTVCRMGGRPHYNHQTWQDGRNVVRYVPAREVDFLQEAIDGYQEFMRLAQQYADAVIAHTRRERKSLFAKAPKQPSRSRAQSAQKGHNEKNEP